MEALKTLALSFNGCIAWEPLCPKELPVVGVVKVLNHSVSPRLSNGNKHRRNVEKKA
jgi:hypothetical protein